MELWQHYHAPATLAEALALLAQQKEQARIIAGGTDLIIELDRGARTLQTLIDITRIPGLDQVAEHEGTLQLGPLVTHNQAANHDGILAHAFPLAQASWEVGAPQLRNRATVAGNLITASPANDTITALMALDASVTLQRAAGPDGSPTSRTVPLTQFYLGFRQPDLHPTEILTSINIPIQSQVGAFQKLALRRAQAIAVINVAVVLWGADGPQRNGTIQGIEHVSGARIALGSVAPTIIRASEAEALLVNADLTDVHIERVAQATATAASPIDDLRGPASYRRQMVQVLTKRLLHDLRAGREREAYPTERANLWQGWGHPSSPSPSVTLAEDSLIETTINSIPTTLHHAAGKTLLRALREDAALTGTKEGCSEGECGACTVLLDGAAVVSCLVPAERAHRATIRTIEGLEVEGLEMEGEHPDGRAAGPPLHPVQRAFVDHDAVQCGYCTPGFIMSAVALLEEVQTPSEEQMKQAIAGNLCRCTGYYKIIDAIRAAARQTSEPAG